MKQRTGYFLALTLIATTLCAGRIFAADQSTRTESRPINEKLVARLTRTFSHVVSRSPLMVDRRLTSPIIQPVIVTSTDRAFSLTLSPFEFRLPPPLV